MARFVSIFRIIVVSLTIYASVMAGIFVIPRFFGIVPYIVESGSMEPEVPTGSVAFIDEKDHTEIGIGDIITYRLDAAADIETGESFFASVPEGTYVTHRVVSVGGDSDGNSFYTTKGDANDAEDANHVYAEQVVGTYVFSIPRIGYFFAWMTKKRLTVFVLGIIALNIASLLLLSAYEEEATGEEKMPAEQVSADKDSDTYK